jgi:pyridoxamine--pyruvate transaminase
MDVHPDDIKSDLFVAGPGKCLGGAPGLTCLSVSERAWRKIEGNKDAPFASVLSIKDWKEAHRADRGFPFTPLMADMQGLDAALDRYLAEGPENVWRRHALTAHACRAGAKAMGLRLWPAREDDASPTVTAIRSPDGIDAERVVAAARERYGVMLSAGASELTKQILRIGHMGPTAHPAYAMLALLALGGALRSVGARVDLAAGIDAAMKVADSAAG